MIAINRFRIGADLDDRSRGRVIETGKRPAWWGWYRDPTTGKVSWVKDDLSGDPIPPHYVRYRLFRAIGEGTFE